jgi:probable phosphoglycerate mutase
MTPSAAHRILLVRHGNTFSPGAPVTRVGARTDLPLVASGFAQAEALGEHFQRTGEVVDHAFCSPLRRTRETAERILASMGSAAPLSVASALTEIDHGPDENRPEAEVVARIGADALRRWEEEAAPPPGWAADPAAAAAEWRTLLDDGCPGQTRLVVTSNGVARFALMAYGRAPLPKLRTGAYGVIMMEKGAPTLLDWDRRP